MKLVDSLVNLVANLGTAKDKRMSTTWQRRVLALEELSTMYREDWLAGKIVDIPADDMTRAWRTFTAPSLSPEQIKELIDAEKDLGTQSKFNEAVKWGRLYGGAAIVLGIEGAGEMAEPLDFERVTAGSLKYALVLDRHDMIKNVFNFTNPTEPDFRKPISYTIQSGSIPIHHTRVLPFEGIELPWREKTRENYWGLPILQRVYDAVMNASGVAESVNSMVYESKIDVLQVKDLFHQLSTKGSDAIVERFLAGDMIKSINNMLLVDMDNETYEQKQLNFTGLDGLILRYLNIAAAAADIPATRLLGESAPGLNATGVEQTRQYYDMVSGQQEVTLGPVLDYWDQVFVRSTLGHYPDDWESTWDSLWQMSEVEQSQVEFNRSQADKNYIETGTITSSIAAKRLDSNNTYEIEDEFIEALEEIETGELEGEIERAGDPPQPPPIPGQPIPGADPEAPVEEEPDEPEED